jgi:hypothetical protein
VPAKVQDHLFRSLGLQLLANFGKSRFPRDRDVFVRSAVPAHRLRQSPECFQIVIRPAFEFGERVGRKKLQWNALRRNLPRGSLDTALARLDHMWFRRFAPGTTDTGESPWFVLPENGGRTRQKDAFLPEDLSHGTRRTPPARGFIVRFYLGLFTQA